MLLARRRGLNVWYYGTISAVYSICFLFPWIYLITRLSRRRMPRVIIVAGYVAMSVGWLTVVSVLALLRYIDDIVQMGESEGEFLPLLSAWVYISVVAIVVSAGAVSWALVRERTRLETSARHGPPVSVEYNHHPRDLIYIVPFALASSTLSIPIWLVLALS